MSSSSTLRGGVLDTWVKFESAGAGLMMTGPEEGLSLALGRMETSFESSWMGGILVGGIELHGLWTTISSTAGEVGIGGAIGDGVSPPNGVTISTGGLAGESRLAVSNLSAWMEDISGESAVPLNKNYRNENSNMNKKFCPIESARLCLDTLPPSRYTSWFLDLFLIEMKNIRVPPNNIFQKKTQGFPPGFLNWYDTWSNNDYW